MESNANNKEKKRLSRRAKLAIISAAVVLIAGASVYAVSAAGSISETEAKQIALAQVSGSDYSHITKFNRDMDDGREEFDVEIIYGGYEYDFEISAKDGTIYDQSKEPVESGEIAGLPPSSAQLPAVDDGGQSVTIEVQPEAQQAASSDAAAQEAPAEQSQPQSQAQSSSADIGLEKAKSIALAEVSGASSGDVIAAWSDYDDGRLEYDVEIIYNGYEYDFEIDGATGKILGKDVDHVEYDDLYYYD